MENAHVRLVPLREVPVDALHAAASTIEAWTLSLAPFGQSHDAIQAYVDEVCGQEDEEIALPFGVFDLRLNRFVGSTRLTNISRPHRRAELGYTWYEPEAWGTAVNPSCKLLLLRHAFEALELERVYFNVNLKNERSWRAVERLGAVREGVLRRDRRMPSGEWRDTVVLSILREEWPQVHAGLRKRLTIAEDR